MICFPRQERVGASNAIHRSSIVAFMALSALIAVVLAGCATTPSSNSGTTKTTASLAPAAQSTQTSAAGSAATTSSTGGASGATADTAPSSGGGFSAGFSDGSGTMFANGATVTLPTGAPPTGRLYPSSNEQDATVYVTIDGSIPTDKNFWQSFPPGTGPNYISSLDAKQRLYRAVAVRNGNASTVATIIVTWKDEASPTFDIPAFAVPKTDNPDGSRTALASGASVTLPLNGKDHAQGRLYITCNYEGATVYITRDGSDPTPKNAWQSSVCDGTYLYSLDPGTTTYKVMAALRGSQSQIATITVTWKAE